MSNYPRENLTTSWVLVNRDGEIVETDYLEDYPSSSTPLDNCLSTSTPLEEARETLKRGTEGLSRISVDDQHSNPEDLSVFVIKSEIASESHIPVDEINRSHNEQGVEELSLDAEAKYANSFEKKSSQSVSQYLEETESQGYTDETDSDLIHLSQDDEDSSPGEILELSTGISSNSSQFSYVNSDGILYNDSAQDEVDSDVLVLDSSHDSLDIKSSLSQDALFDVTGTIDDSSIPERELIDLSLNPKIRQYIHTPNNRLNVALTIIMMLSVTVVLSLAIGHFLGASRQWMAQTKKALVLEELRLRNLAEQMPKDSIDFWRKKYKEQLLMNERLKTVLAMDIQQMNRKKISRKEQEFHQSKLDMISLQIDHLQILKDLQIILIDLQLKEQEQQLNANAALNEKEIVMDNDSLNQKAQSVHSDELIVASDHEDLKNSEERLPMEASLLNDNAEKAETNPTFFETSFIQRVDSEEKGSLIIAVDDDKIHDDPEKSYEDINLEQILEDKIVQDYSQKSYEEINLDQQTLDDKIVHDNPQKFYEDEINVDHQTSIPLLPPPPPPENIVNEVPKVNIDINPNSESQIKSEEKFSEPKQIKTPSVNVNNQELLVQSLKSRILQLQHENNELRAEMTHLRYKQLNPQTGSQKNILTPSPFQEPLVQNNCKNAESLNVSPDKKCTNDNSLFNLSKTLNYYWQQFDKFTSKSIDQHLHNLPGSHLFNTEELVKKLNHTKNAFYTLQSNLAQKWMELGTVKNTSESFHKTDHKVNDPLWKMGDILQQTWNKVKNISQNFFVKEGSTVKKLAKKVSQKLGRIEKMLEKKWSELNEKLNKKVFSHQQRIREHQNIDDFYHWKVADKKWNKKENKIQSRCNKIVEKIKENKIWFNHIQESRNPYFSADFQSWLKEQKFFDDEQETKEFWKALKKTMKYPDQKELMWLICQYKWWQPNNRNLDVCIDNQNNCKTDKTMENQDLEINKMNTHSMAQEESPNKIFWVFGRAEDREKQRATPENKNANWFFNRARSRDNLRDKPHPKAEWLFKRAEDRKYQRLFQNEFQENWKIYDWLNKRAEIRKHLRYLDGFK